MTSAIQVQGLSKKYLIRHKAKRDYTNLREEIYRSAKTLVSRAVGVARGNEVSGNASRAEEFWALKDIDFEIERGGRVGIIGRNGAGKSTLLKILSRITEPTEGRLAITGRVASLLEVGTGFHPELTGRENIFLNGVILGMSKAEIKSRFDQIVAFAEIEKFLDTPVKRYSSGMYTRLAFSVAAHLQTEIMIVDEVLAVGDIGFQRKCLGKMEEAATEGRTILFVSHNMGAVQSLCDRAILLENGKVKKDGSAKEVVRDYMTSAKLENVGQQERGYYVDRALIEKNKTDSVSITGCEIINPQDTELGPRTGDPLRIRIHYSALKQCQSPAFVVIIRDPMGYELLRLSTMPISGFVIERLGESGYVDLDIKMLPLVAGNYSMDIGFVREGIEWIVKLEEVVKFEVEQKDFYGSGLIMDQRRGLLVVPHTWHHENSFSSGQN
jgi:lipopolysaccharide transport system ATP-binding protein